MASALTYLSPGETVLRDVALQRDMGHDFVRVKTKWSGISRGTERLVFEGRIPPSEYNRMRAPHQRGDFPFPVTYGYSAVGEVIEGSPDLLGKPVFCLFPHQDVFDVARTDVTVLPPDLPPRRATLAANMETALNAVWDGGAGPGDRIAVVGGGIVGSLIAGLVGSIPGTDVTLVDVDQARAALADHINVRFSAPDNAPCDCDVVFHTSSSGSGAVTALNCGGLEARIIEVSWFGDTAPALPLGGAFHARRLEYRSSQVGQVAPTRRARWNYARRLAKALDLLRDKKYDALITGEVAFADLPAMLPGILAANAPGLATAVRYKE